MGHAVNTLRPPRSAKNLPSARCAAKAPTGGNVEKLHTSTLRMGRPQHAHRWQRGDTLVETSNY
eukprot:9475181-Pyramimonas_sp.AAC.1